MVDTAGNKLRRAREQKHLSLADAARATKIRVQQLADLEADEYSNFANLAYARSYVANYSKFLQVDLRNYLEGFSDPGSFGLEDYQYLSAKPVGVYRIPYRQSNRRVRRPQRRQLIGAAVVLAALAAVLVGWILLVNIQRLGDLDQLSARQAARQNASGTNPGGAVPAAESATTVNVSAPAPAISPAPTSELLTAPPVPPTGALPLNAPAADTPAPTAAPADVPAQVSIPALALTTKPATTNSALPLSGDGREAPELLTAHANGSQPQKVVNDHPLAR